MTERTSPQSGAEARLPPPQTAMPPLSPLQGVAPPAESAPLPGYTGPLTSNCLVSVATATSPLDYFDALPSDKKEGEEGVQYEKQGLGKSRGSAGADLSLRGGVEVKLGESGEPEADKLAELDFLRESIESYRGPRGERLQLVPIASGAGDSVTLGINVKSGEEDADTASVGIVEGGSSLGLENPPGGFHSSAEDLGKEGGENEEELLGKGLEGLEVPEIVGASDPVAESATFSLAFDSTAGVVSTPGIEGQPTGGRSGLGGLTTQQPALDTGAGLPVTSGFRTPGIVLESPPRRKRSGGFARKRSRFGGGADDGTPVNGLRPFVSREPFGSQELIGETEAVVGRQVAINTAHEATGSPRTSGQATQSSERVRESGLETGFGASEGVAKGGAENRSLVHGMEAAFGSTESLPSAFERVLQNQSLSEAQDDQGRPIPPPDRTNSGGPSLGGAAGTLAPLGWAASIWRTPSPIPWPFNLPSNVSPPVSPSSPRSFDSGFGYLPFLAGANPNISDLMRQNSLGDEVLSPNWRPGSALQATLSGGLESGLASDQVLTRQGSLEDGTLSPSWRPGSAFQPVFPTTQLPSYTNLVQADEAESKKKVGYFPGLGVNQDGSEGSTRGRQTGLGAGSVPNPGQVIARPKAMTPQVPFILERVLAAQQHSRVSEERGFSQGLEGSRSTKEEPVGRDEKGTGFDNPGVSDKPGDGQQGERSGSVDWSRLEGSLENIQSSPTGFEVTSTNPLALPVDSWPGKQFQGGSYYSSYAPPFMIEGYPDAASLHQAAYEEEQRRMIQQNWPYSPPQPSVQADVAVPRGTQEEIPGLALPPSVHTQSAGPLSPPNVNTPPVYSGPTAVGENKPVGEPFQPVRSVKSLPVTSDTGTRGRKRKAGRSTASDSSTELRKIHSQPSLSASSPSSGDTLSQDLTPQPTPPLRPIQVKPIAPKIEAQGGPFYPAGPPFFQTPKPQQAFPSPLLRVRLSDLVLRDGSASASYEYAVRNLAASLQSANAAVLQLGVEDAKLVREGLVAQRLWFEGRRAGELGRVKEGSSEGYEVDGFVRRKRGVAFFRRAGRPYKDGQPPLLWDLYRLLGDISRTVLAATARHVGLRADAFSDLLDDVPLSRGATGSSVLASERIGLTFPAEGPPERPEGEVRMGRGFFTLVAADSPGLQVSDAQGFWYVADQQLSPGNLLLLPGQSLHRVTAGIVNPAAFCINPAPQTLSPASQDPNPASQTLTPAPQTGNQTLTPGPRPINPNLNPSTPDTLNSAAFGAQNSSVPGIPNPPSNSALNPAVHPGLNPALNPGLNPGLNPIPGPINPSVNERSQIVFHLHPSPSAQLSAAKLQSAGIPVPPNFRQPVTAREFVEQAVRQEGGTLADAAQANECSRAPEPTLRYTLSDPLSGAPMVDSLLGRCGHSFGAASMQRVAESGTCPLCGKEVNTAAMVPNPALRNAASFLESPYPTPPFARFPFEPPLPDPTGLFWDQLRQRQMVSQRRPVQPPGFGGLSPHMNPVAQNPLLRVSADARPAFEAHGGLGLAPSTLTPFKRKLEPQAGNGGFGWPGFQGLSDPRMAKRRGPEGAPVSVQPEKPRGVQYPYKVREHVVIKGNKRTPAHVVGKRAIITEQCLNGWYMVRTLDHGETLRLQYRSLERLSNKPEQRPVAAPSNPQDVPGGSASNPVSIDTHRSPPASGGNKAAEGGNKLAENKAVAIAARSQQLVMMALNRRNAEPTKVQLSNKGIPASASSQTTAAAAAVAGAGAGTVGAAAATQRADQARVATDPTHTQVAVSNEGSRTHQQPG